MSEETTVPTPRENPDLLGHEAAERTLLDAWRSGRLPHAWLITGPAGIGKATLAYRFARFALARGGNPDDMFGAGSAADSLYVDPEDPVFRRVASSGHSDLMTLERRPDKEGKRLRASIVIDDVRAAGRFLSLTAGEGGWRVLLVDTADDLNNNAANALLKMLEEPPRNTLALLVSHSPGRLAATIRSRCCRLALRPPPLETTTALITRYLPGFSPDEANALARLADGSTGRAIRLAETGALEIFHDILGLLVPLPRTDIPALHRLADRLARPDAEIAYRTAMDLLIWWLARMIRAGARTQGARPGDAELLPGEDDCRQRLLGLAGLDRWAEVWEKITRLIAQADGLNLDRKQTILNAFHAMETAVRV